eukprot:6199636-Pleurochrysis_carterae.AAC.6
MRRRATHIHSKGKRDEGERHWSVARVEGGDGAVWVEPVRNVVYVGDGGADADDAQLGDGLGLQVDALREQLHPCDDSLECRSALLFCEQVDLVDEQQSHAADDALRVAAEAREGVPLLGRRQHHIGAADRALLRRRVIANVAGQLEALAAHTRQTRRPVGVALGRQRLQRCHVHHGRPAPAFSTSATNSSSACNATDASAVTPCTTFIGSVDCTRSCGLGRPPATRPTGACALRHVRASGRVSRPEPRHCQLKHYCLAAACWR